MVELFSECQDMTKQQQHSSRLHIQTFKEGRLHGERLKDSLEELNAGDYNEGFENTILPSKNFPINPPLPLIDNQKDSE